MFVLDDFDSVPDILGPQPRRSLFSTRLILPLSMIS